MPVGESLNQVVEISYTNWQGKFGVRRILPSRIYFGVTEHHPEPQWLLEAWDLDKDAARTFAVADISNWRQVVS